MKVEDLERSIFLKERFASRGENFVKDVANVLYVHDVLSIENKHVMPIEAAQYLYTLMVSEKPEDAAKLVELMPNTYNKKGDNILDRFINILCDDNHLLRIESITALKFIKAIRINYKDGIKDLFIHRDFINSPRELAIEKFDFQFLVNYKLSLLQSESAGMRIEY